MRFQLRRDLMVSPYNPDATFRDLRLVCWMNPPQTIVGRLVFVVLTPLYLAFTLLLAAVQLPLDFLLSLVSWFRIVSDR
jgi:hypothetical protein